MFKKFRIKHEGFHRLAILIGIITIPFWLWVFTGFYRDIFYNYLNSWEELGIWIILAHIAVYPIGYFSMAFIAWVIHGFKK